MAPPTGFRAWAASAIREEIHPRDRLSGADFGFTNFCSGYEFYPLDYMNAGLQDELANDFGDGDPGWIGVAGDVLMGEG